MSNLFCPVCKPREQRIVPVELKVYPLTGHLEVTGNADGVETALAITDTNPYILIKFECERGHVFGIAIEKDGTGISVQTRKYKKSKTMNTVCGDKTAQREL